MKRAPFAALVCVACATGGGLRDRALAVDNDVAVARRERADQCAPRELAIAESNLRFARVEIDQGDAARASEHLALAQDAARRAAAASRNCGPVSVVIREQTRVALKDTDGDGIPDVDDQCPDLPGLRENRGCPVLADRDLDRVADDIDRCPDQKGPRENFGCPLPDRDGDGVADQDDLCPLVAGPIENHGCPWADRDHDGVADKDDKCPDEPGPKENQGCPRKQTLVIVRRDRIELRQQIRFAQNKSRILKPSFPMLLQVASALTDAPSVRVRIEGHTDNVGTLDTNLKLSQSRAESVKAFLASNGVTRERLDAEGFGPTRPLASNATKAGRAANRRVDFRIVHPGAGKASGPEK
jgi:outer membrane protein OmpA-like peptidoglycan-associated protein